ncbi:MAG: glycosyltransferase family 4 protein [Limnochordia bacterium]|jgi:glycosyltransferase involved in cell wall biosynthesis
MKPTNIRIAVLTDYLLHPNQDDFLAVAENLQLLHLIEYLRDVLGCTVDVFQISTKPKRTFRGFQITGIAAECDRYGMFPGASTSFISLGLDYDLCIYYQWHMAFPRVCPKSVVVSHGIYWDSPGGYFNRLSLMEQKHIKDRLLYGLTASLAFVAGDRNTINVIRVLWPGYTQRLEYLPPGVDLEQFTPAVKDRNDCLRVVCPQDFTQEEGVNEILSLCRIFQNLEPSIEFHIVGHTREFGEALQLAHQVRVLPNARFYWVPTAQLTAVYHACDLALFPSRSSAGPSLYCLQAMACGLPVIAGLTGGLGEMVVDGWNGFLLEEPGIDHLVHRVYQLTRNQELRTQMGRNARLLAEGYPISRWRNRWLHLVERLLLGTSQRGET